MNECKDPCKPLSAEKAVARCTCDDPGEGRCPRCGRENALQDRALKSEAEWHAATVLRWDANRKMVAAIDAARKWKCKYNEALAERDEARKRACCFMRKDKTCFICVQHAQANNLLYQVLKDAPINTLVDRALMASKRVSADEKPETVGAHGPTCECGYPDHVHPNRPQMGYDGVCLACNCKAFKAERQGNAI